VRHLQGRIFLFIPLFFILTIFSCDNSTDPVNEEVVLTEGLIGGWKGVYFEFTNQNNPTQSVDLASYGVSHSMLITKDSVYTANTVFLGQEMIETGIISVDGNRFTFKPENDSSRTGTFSLADFKLHLEIDDEHFDFDQDGTDEPATLIVDLEKVN